jgi:hypothetical protein
MAQFNPKEVVFNGDRRQYYSYDGQLYTRTFPTEWAESHLPGTGPEECSNCAWFGSWNGVFIGYCANCVYYYKGERGCGFADCGIELEVYPHEAEHSENADKYLRAFDTYLKDIKLDEIGDKDFMDSAKMMEQPQQYYHEYDYAENIESDEDEAAIYPEEEYERGALTPYELSWCIDRVGTKGCESP